jgi:hypothetical protein
MIMIAQATVPSTSAAWLSFLSTLIWQLIVVLVLVFFRQEVARLLRRMASLEGGGAKVVFQETKVGAKMLAVDAATPSLAGPEGFLEASTIEKLVEESRLTSDDEKVKRTMLLFATSEQRTWIVATDRQLFFVLDDDDTRADNQLIQSQQSFSEIKRVHANAEDASTGVITITPGAAWYYSVPLHPDPRHLARQVAALIGISS